MVHIMRLFLTWVRDRDGFIMNNIPISLACWIDDNAYYHPNYMKCYFCENITEDTSEYMNQGVVGRYPTCEDCLDLFAIA